jgi:transcriptional regulator with XRE-family HTH domain
LYYIAKFGDCQGSYRNLWRYFGGGGYVFQERFRELLTQRGYTAYQVAKQLGISPQTVKRWEKGESVPQGQKLEALATHLGVSIDYLMMGEGASDAAPSLDEQLSGIDFALYSETKEMTDAQKQDVLRFVQFVKQQGKETK